MENNECRAADMDIHCSQCKAPLTCQPEGDCWCADLPNILPVPDGNLEGCLCRDCLTKRLELQPPTYIDPLR
jgi:hypothetical protein